jgi:alpha-mannosidase
MRPGLAAAPAWTPADTATLENESLRLDFDSVNGIAKLVWKPTGRVLMENAGDWLVAQSDDGSFQIENPNGPEVAVSSGAICIQTSQSPLGQKVRLFGLLPRLAWAGADSLLDWHADFTLPTGSPAVHLALRLDWRGEKTRVRLTLPTEIDSSTGIYEVPFGVVRRKPYSPRTNAKGEWPAHRFVALEDHSHGIALINTGVGGVEVSGGRIYTTLLRAPRAEYAGMVTDGTSSQHGTHDYTFAIQPYAGSWADADVVRTAQALNNPLRAESRQPALRTG